MDADAGVDAGVGTRNEDGEYEKPSVTSEFDASYVTCEREKPCAEEEDKEDSDEELKLLLEKVVPLLSNAFFENIERFRSVCRPVPAKEGPAEPAGDCSTRRSLFECIDLYIDLFFGQFLMK